MKFKNFVSVLLFLIAITTYSQDYYSALTISPDLKKNANAVVRLNDLSFVIKSRKSMKIVQKRIVTILNEKGNRYVMAYTGYDKYRKIKKIEAIVYNEAGEEIKKIKKRDFIDQSAVDGGTLYSDSRVLYMAYMPVSYPYTVEFNYEMETPNTASIYSWTPIDGYYVSVENDVFSVTDIANLGLRSKTKRFEDFNVKTSNNETTIKYKVSNIKALKPESLSPGISNIRPHSMVAAEKFHYNGVDGNARNWTEFGEWMLHGLLEGRQSVTDVTKNEVLQLVDGIDDPLKRARLVYKYVQNNTRYISVQVGIGGIQPISAMEVDRLKYGDCKGLTNYTQSLLTIANVPSFYSVVQAGTEIVDFDPEFASLEQGNHIILGIENKDELIWVDCTSQVHPFGFIGDFTDSRNVLLVKKGESKIVKTTAYPDSLSIQETEAKVVLDLNGNISSNVSIKTKGIQYDSRFGIEKKSDKDILEYYKNYWDNVNNIEIGSYKFHNDKEAVEFKETVKVSALGYGSINGERLILSPNIFNKNTYVPDRYRNRKYPLVIQRGYKDVDHFNITIPEGYKIEALPDNVSVKNTFGEYLINLSIVGNTIQYSRELFIKSGSYLNSEYDGYRNFRKKIKKLDNAIIVLTKSK